MTTPGTEARVRGDRIADLRSRRGALLSLYVARPSPGGFAALLSDLVKPIRERSSDFDRDVRMSVRADVERVHDLADRLELDSAPGYAVFASSLDDIFELDPLDQPPPDVASLGPRPYLRPLRAMPRPTRSAVLVADRAMARTFVAIEGVVEEIDQAIRADIGNKSWGGFSGYEEHSVRSRAQEVSARLWREAGERLLGHHIERPFDYLAIGAQEELIEEIARTLHPYLARLPRETFQASPQSVQLPSLRVEIAAMDGEMRRRRHAALAGRVCDTAWGGGNAVLGLNDVITSANAQAIDTLVVAGRFARPGSLCDTCGYLAREGSTCPVCGADLFPIDDVVAAVMEAVVASSGSISQLSVPSPLDREGIGALTRFPVPAPR